MLVLEDINKKYIVNNKAGISVEALKGISLAFSSYGITAIFGKSGSGKTTLLNIIGGIDSPTSGHVFFMGEDINNYSMNDSDNYRNQYISFIFQNYNLLSEYNVIDNVKIALRLQEIDEIRIQEKAVEALKQVGLEGLENRKINTLSGGQQQRVVIARAIAKDSKILLCDEPTGNLDSKTANDIMAIFKKVSETRLVILITHDEDIANNCADRKIYLKDGKIIKEEILSNKTSQIISNEIPKKEYQGFTLKDSFTMIKDNIAHSILVTLVVVLLLLSAFSLSTLFASLVNYDSQKAYAYTLQENDQYIVQITKYIDQPITTSNNSEPTIIHGPQIYYERVEEEDVSALKTLFGDNANFYPSYFFNKNFQDFTDEYISDTNSGFIYDAINFREVIAVNDFSQFHMKLLYGSYPAESNDVLIYDYMVYSMIQRGVLFGEIEDNIGIVLEDQQTSLQMKIVGILKSDYERYEYIKNEETGHEFEETYLTSLQSIYCMPDFVDIIYSEREIISVLETNVAYSEDGVLNVLDCDIKKYQYTTNLSYDFLATIDDYQSQSGIILTKSQVSSILDIDSDNLSNAIINEFLSSYFVYFTKTLYDWSIERTYLYRGNMGIIGVIDDVSLDDNTFLYYEPNIENMLMMNSDFRQIYLSLGNNWSKNQEVLNQFEYIAKTNEFYDENPDYYEEGFVDYNAFGLLIDQSNNYLENVSDFAKDILIPIIITTVIALAFFSFYSIKKFDYKIGILKALGARNKDIALIFGLQIVLVALLTYALSIPLSYFLMYRVNYNFVNEIHSGLVFFKVDVGILAFGLLASFVMLLISISIPLILFMKNTPIEIIRKTQ